MIFCDLFLRFGENVAIATPSLRRHRRYGISQKRRISRTNASRITFSWPAINGVTALCSHVQGGGGLGSPPDSGPDVSVCLLDLKSQEHREGGKLNRRFCSL